MIAKVDKAFRDSILYTFKNPEEAMPFIHRHAQEMEDAVMKHIGLFG